MIVVTDSQVKALQGLAAMGEIMVSLKAVPRIQREVEGRITRLARELLQPQFDWAKKSARQSTWSWIKASQMEMNVRGLRSQLIATGIREAERAAQYGHNRIIHQVQQMRESAVFDPVDIDLLDYADDMAMLEGDRMVMRLVKRIHKLDHPSPEDVQQVLDIESRAFGRELANSARCKAEYETARVLNKRFEWDDSDDNRVRPSHKLVDGEQVEPGEKFSNGLRYPRDPEGALNEIKGCRCRIKLVARSKGRK